MAFSNSTGDRMDELRFRSQQSSRHDSLRLGLTSPPRNGNRLPPPSSSAGDARGGFTLTRRFTTDSGRVPTLSSIASQRGLDGQGQDYSTPPSVSILLCRSALDAHTAAALHMQLVTLLL
jgi:hypothetical protein